MPAEILLEIFHLLPESGRIYCSHVCATWRSILLNDAYSWSGLLISQSKTAVQKVHAYCIRLNGRSLKRLSIISTEKPPPEAIGSHIFNLQDFKFNPSNMKSSGWTAWSKLIAPSIPAITEIAQRLRSLDLTLPDQIFMPQKLFPFISLFSNLEECSIKFINVAAAGSIWRFDALIPEHEPDSVLVFNKLRALDLSGSLNSSQAHATAPSLQCPVLKSFVWHLPNVFWRLVALQLNAPQLERVESRAISHSFIMNARPYEGGDFRNLKHLKFEGCSTTECVFVGNTSMPELETLEIKGCGSNVINVSLLNLSSHTPLLKKLHLTSVVKLNDGLILSLMRNWPLLESISFETCSLQGSFIEDLSSLNLPLKHFGLSQCAEIKASPIIKLVQAGISAGRGLQSLYLWDCPSIEPEGLAWLRQVVPQVKHRYRDPKGELKAKRRLL